MTLAEIFLWLNNVLGEFESWLAMIPMLSSENWLVVLSLLPSFLPFSSLVRGPRWEKWKGWFLEHQFSCLFVVYVAGKLYFALIEQSWLSAGYLGVWLGLLIMVSLLHGKATTHSILWGGSLLYWGFFLVASGESYLAPFIELGHGGRGLFFFLYWLALFVLLPRWVPQVCKAEWVLELWYLVWLLSFFMLAKALTHSVLWSLFLMSILYGWGVQGSIVFVFGEGNPHTEGFKDVGKKLLKPTKDKIMDKFHKLPPSGKYTVGGLLLGVIGFSLAEAHFSAKKITNSIVEKNLASAEKDLAGAEKDKLTSLEIKQRMEQNADMHQMKMTQDQEMHQLKLEEERLKIEERRLRVEAFKKKHSGDPSSSPRGGLWGGWSGSNSSNNDVG